MKTTSKIVVAIIVLLSFTVSEAQIKNETTETVRIYGKCTICKTAIEKAGNIKKEANVNWDKDTKMATLTYNSANTNQEEILKRIALAGYDSDEFLAPDDAYASLPGCCKYERVNKTASNTAAPKMEMYHSGHSTQTVPMETSQETKGLEPVFKAYFAVKDALVKTDGSVASAKAKELLASINAVKMETLETEPHNVWMKVMSGLRQDTERIAGISDVELQREYFMTLSQNMYALIKVSKTETPTYYQFCPMANNGRGANWLSKEKAIKNPYYGAQMLSCGSVQETME